METNYVMSYIIIGVLLISHVTWVVCFLRWSCAPRAVQILAGVLVGYLLQLWGWLN